MSSLPDLVSTLPDRVQQLDMNKAERCTHSLQPAAQGTGELPSAEDAVEPWNNMREGTEVQHHLTTLK